MRVPEGTLLGSSVKTRSSAFPASPSPFLLSFQASRAPITHHCCRQAERRGAVAPSPPNLHRVAKSVRHHPSPPREFLEDFHRRSVLSAGHRRWPCPDNFPSMRCSCQASPKHPKALGANLVGSRRPPQAPDAARLCFSTVVIDSSRPATSPATDHPMVTPVTSPPFPLSFCPESYPETASRPHFGEGAATVPCRRRRVSTSLRLGCAGAWAGRAAVMAGPLSWAARNPRRVQHVPDLVRPPSCGPAQGTISLVDFVSRVQMFK
jgi:hypothetical protein